MEHVIRNNKNGTVMSIFRDCVEAFTTQPLDMICYEDNSGKSLLIYDEGDWTWNRQHPYWEEHIESTGLLREIGEVFLSEYPLFEKQLYDKSAFVKRVRRDVARRLNDLLDAITHGMDLELLTALAREKYESALGDGLHMILIPYPMSPDCVSELIQFEESGWVRLSYSNIHTLRKYLNMGSTSRLAICYAKGPGESSGERIQDFYAIGLMPKEAEKRFPCICFKKHMEWHFCLPYRDETTNQVKSGCRARCIQGRLFLPLLKQDSYEKREIEKAFASYKALVTEQHKKNIYELLQKIKMQKKGALLIVSDIETIRNEKDRLCEVNCGIALKEAINTANTFPELLNELSSIDGAVLVDLDGNFHACGVILDGDAVRGNMARGSRFNSAKSYLSHLHKAFPKHPALGIVVSEDGMVNFLTGSTDA